MKLPAIPGTSVKAVEVTRKTLSWAGAIVLATIGVMGSMNAYFLPRTVFASELSRVQATLNIGLIDTQLAINRAATRELTRQINELEAKRDAKKLSSIERALLAQLQIERAELQAEAIALKANKQNLKDAAAKLK